MKLTTKKTTGATATALALLLTGLALPAQAQEAKKVEAKPAAVSAASAGDVRTEVLAQLEGAEKKLMALAEAIPAEKYGWRPAEGVRSIGEVFMHVAGASYFIPTLWGTKPPADSGDLRGLEKQGGDKAKVVDALKKAFVYAKSVIAAVPDADLERKVTLFDHEGTVREGLLIVAVHAHEHLGQQIAYARMNGVTPPWNAKE
jgi:uncharacterized damage-inducible protein DinB